MKTHAIVLYVRANDRSAKDVQHRISKFFLKHPETLAEFGFDVQATGRITNFALKGSDHPSHQPRKRDFDRFVAENNDE